MNIFELKSSITKNLKNSVNELSIRMEREEERNTELEGRTIEITQSKQQKENNRLWGEKNRLGDLQNQIKYPRFMALEFQKERKKRVGIKKYLKK